LLKTQTNKNNLIRLKKF